MEMKGALVPADTFTYKYLAGPVDTQEELEAGSTEGNCRYALQLYFFRMHNIFLEKDKIYLPGGYKVLGKFIFKEEPINFDQLMAGDIIYAQNFRNKEGKELNKGIESYKDKDEWLYYLHSAVYLGKIDPETDDHYVWHATNIHGGPVVWPLDTFRYFYKPISAKRVL